MTGKRNSAEQIANKQSKTRLKWTEAMNTKFLECKREAKDFVQSKDPLRKADGKNQGYMAIMKQLWDNSEFADLNISTQNLRDQAARIGKSLGSEGSTIREESNTANDLLQPSVDNKETSSEDLEQNNYEFNNDAISPRNLHSTKSQVPEGNETPAEVKNIFQAAKLVFASVAADPGDFSNRLLDSRTKKRPTNQDIININAAIEQLMKQNDVINAPDPAQNPFLWLANCVIYSVVVAFLVLKGWKKKSEQKKSPDEKIKEIYEAQAGEIRNYISVAAAETERLRANRKLTSKGKKNRAKLLKNCKSLSVADLVVYMEKEISKLRKLKRNFWRVKRLEEDRKLNQKFYTDPGSIYASFVKMLESQADIDKPKYDRVTQGTQVNDHTFTNIDETASFWRSLLLISGGKRQQSWIKK